MNAAALKLMTQPLRVAVLAAEPRRLEALSRWVQGFGHVVVTASDDPSIVLADGVVEAPFHLPTVALGTDRETSQARLPRDASPEQIDAALRAVSVGLSVTIAEEFGRGFEAAHEGDEQTLLTPREVEVLTAISNGLTNKEVARELGISRHTVKFHVESLMRKLGVSSRAEAVSKSMRLRLLEPYRL
jgi:DNA-binding CsgD family transcriptional regulator